MELKLSRYIVEVTIPQFESEPTADRLLYSTRSGKTIRLSRRYLDILYTANFTLLPDKLFSLLFDNEILIPAEEEEKEALLTRNLLALEDVTGNSATLLVPVKTTPDNNFFDAVMVQLNSVLATISTNNIKGFKYTIRLLMVIQHSVTDLDWLLLLDTRLREIKSPVKTTFTLNMLYATGGYNNLVIPPLQALTVNRLFFVFNEEKYNNLQHSTADIDIIQRDLLTGQGHPGLRVQMVFNVTDKSWNNWSGQFIHAISASARHQKVVIEFAMDKPVSEMKELEKELIYFLSDCRIKCKWLPRPYHLCFVPALQQEDLSPLSVNQSGIQLINTDLNLDGKELLQIIRYLSATTYHPCNQQLPLHEQFPDTYSVSNIQERILVTAGIPLRRQQLETL
ncbi:hypothetical protein CLV51_101801 [Chitinophaga niastensis]|uniref:Uncharacterized protein n=1 Tax=Chitinophaga niastensis TaxID=536980 RepID=A0A2P8HTD7_CHINA|nr:hypothetical protein [Chitinophaga niastensis]PSL49468.1 hypothetical protein CLV51_101801 [Chitinophaga niastensis]